MIAGPCQFASARQRDGNYFRIPPGAAGGRDRLPPGPRPREIAGNNLLDRHFAATGQDQGSLSQAGVSPVVLHPGPVITLGHGGELVFQLDEMVADHVHPALPEQARRPLRAGHLAAHAVHRPERDVRVHRVEQGPHVVAGHVHFTDHAVRVVAVERLGHDVHLPVGGELAGAVLKDVVVAVLALRPRPRCRSRRCCRGWWWRGRSRRPPAAISAARPRPGTPASR